MINYLRSRWIAVTIVVSLLTMVVIATAMLTLTSLGCSAARSLGIKSTAGRCVQLPVAVVHKPTPSPSPVITGQQAPSPFPPPNSLPYQPPDSSPYQPPDSGPYQPPQSGPYFPPESGSGPPFFGPDSGPANSPYASTLSCELPVYAGGPGSGGFVSFPSGAFTADPRSSVTLPSPSPGSPSPAPNYGYGQGWLSYDRQYGVWLPVQRSSISPDGSRYAYASPDSIYVQSVGRSTQIELGQGRQWSIIGLQADRVYAEPFNQAGLWVLPFTGSPREIIAGGYWQAVTATAAFGTATSAVPQGASNTIIKLDLATGSQQNWFTRPQASSAVQGLDAQGNPIIFLTAPYGSAWWIATGPDTATLLSYSANSGYNAYTLNNGTPIADSHGIWFAGWTQNKGQGFILYKPGSGLYWMSSLGAQLAGPCA